MKYFVAFLLVVLTGCASAPRQTAKPPPDLFTDAAFAAPSQPVNAGDLFKLSPEMRAYLRSPSFQDKLRARNRENGLLDALYSKTDLQLEYESTYTRNAAETFRDRSGNCMSLVIMTAAFAKELGIDVNFQSVAMETWSRTNDVYMLSGHVNILLGSRPVNTMGFGEAEQVLLVDFMPSPRLDTARMHALSEDEIVAMYMNNRAAENMLEGRLDDAYWWARAAVLADPRTAVHINTLGVIYERHGDMAMAERAYRAALEREPENLIALNNIQPVLQVRGKSAEAQAIKERLAKLEPTPPFYYFNQGVIAYREGDYRKARALFEREVSRAPYNDEFHFWLAASQLQLGQTGKARDQLALAVENSTQNQTRKLYAAKLSHLKQMSAVQ